MDPLSLLAPALRKLLDLERSLGNQIRDAFASLDETQVRVNLVRPVHVDELRGASGWPEDVEIYQTFPPHDPTELGFCWMRGPHWLAGPHPMIDRLRPYLEGRPESLPMAATIPWRLGAWATPARTRSTGPSNGSVGAPARW